MPSLIYRAFGLDLWVSVESSVSWNLLVFSFDLALVSVGWFKDSIGLVPFVGLKFCLAYSIKRVIILFCSGYRRWTRP